MSNYVFEICNAEDDGSIECRNYNTGEMRPYLSKYGCNSTLSKANKFDILYIKQREVSDAELESFMNDAENWRIYIINNNGFDHDYKGYFDTTDYYVNKISANRILVSQGNFAGVVFSSQDTLGNCKKLCEGDVNVALITDAAVTEYPSSFAEHTETTSFIFLAYTGWYKGTSYVNDYKYMTFYLGKK